MTPLLDEGFLSWRVTPEEMDRLWSEGWRHFGPMFYRYPRANHGGQIMDVRPMRVALAQFSPSKSQRRILRRNKDLRTRIRPTVIDETRRRLFQQHRSRFAENVPDRLEDFLGVDPGHGPCLNVEIALYLGERLIAASYLDIGLHAVSSVYAFFDLTEHRRSLGILTILHEIGWARERECQFYYPGYAYAQQSHYDYKKKFAGIQSYDWKEWAPLPRLAAQRAE
ncbi:MAG: arginine-tRNA-protein transferase [Verrucomicrobiales bacterium]